MKPLKAFHRNSIDTMQKPNGPPNFQLSSSASVCMHTKMLMIKILLLKINNFQLTGEYKTDWIDTHRHILNTK